MKVHKLILLGILIVLSGVSQSNADLYNDTTGEEAMGDYNHIDIASTFVTNDATDISFTINLVGDPIAVNWGKYLIGIDSVSGGDTSGNGWGRPISLTSGMDYFIGSWVDSGNGAEVYNHDGSSWNLLDATYGAATDIQTPVTTANAVTLTTTLSSLGLQPGDTFVFDVWTSGGGATDSAIDALSDSSTTITSWNEQYDSTSSLSYMVIPEPATMGLISLFGIGILATRRLFRK